MGAVVPHPACDEEIHGNGDGGRVKQRDPARAPETKLGKSTERSFHLTSNRAKSAFKQVLSARTPSIQEKSLYVPAEGPAMDGE